jgi:iron complex outermembrane receptor protein
MAGETDNLRDSTRADKRREKCPSLLAAAAALPLAAAPQPFASAQGAITEIEEVIVTARKREERLQDVPVSVAVLRAGEIELNRISNVTDAFGRIPGLYLSGNVLSPSRAYSKLNIRGIGTLSNTEPGVAVIVDGVYAPALSFDLDFIEVERIEVLRGPQGSLFGRNTEGGVINIHITDSQKASAYARADLTSAAARADFAETVAEAGSRLPVVPAAPNDRRR